MADKITSKELMAQKNDFIIIDVRELDELENGIIEDSIHMPLGLCIRNVKKKQIDDMKDKKICTYCGTGYRGNIAADELNKDGFYAVTLDGGYSTWMQKIPQIKKIRKLMKKIRKLMNTIVKSINITMHQKMEKILMIIFDRNLQ